MPNGTTSSIRISVNEFRDLAKGISTNASAAHILRSDSRPSASVAELLSMIEHLNGETTTFADEIHEEGYRVSLGEKDDYSDRIVVWIGLADSLFPPLRAFHYRKLREFVDEHPDPPEEVVSTLKRFESALGGDDTTIV